MSAGHRTLIVRYQGGGIRNIRSETLCHMLNIAVEERRAKHCRTKYRRSLNACLPACRWSGLRLRVKEASGRQGEVPCGNGHAVKWREAGFGVAAPASLAIVRRY